jgi:hypothetical protein
MDSYERIWGHLCPAKEEYWERFGAEYKKRI